MGPGEGTVVKISPAAIRQGENVQLKLKKWHNCVNNAHLFRLPGLNHVNLYQTRSGGGSGELVDCSVAEIQPAFGVASIWLCDDSANIEGSRWSWWSPLR